MFSSLRRSLSGMGLASPSQSSHTTVKAPSTDAKHAAEEIASDQQRPQEAATPPLSKVYGVLVMETKKGEETARFSIQWEETTIGRSCKNDIRMYEPSVSLRHCRLVFQSDTEGTHKPYLHITGTHGVTINGQKMGPSETLHSLNNGDLLKINKFYLRLQLDAEQVYPASTSAEVPSTPALGGRRIRMSLVNAAQIHTPARPSEDAPNATKDIVIYELADRDADEHDGIRDNDGDFAGPMPSKDERPASPAVPAKSTSKRRERRKSSFYGRAPIGTELGGSAKPSPSRDFYPEERQLHADAPTGLPTSISLPEEHMQHAAQSSTTQSSPARQVSTPRPESQNKGYSLVSSPALPLVPPNLSPSRFNRKISLRTETLLRASAIKAEQWRQEREAEERARCLEEREWKMRNGKIPTGDLDIDDEDEVERSLSMLGSPDSDEMDTRDDVGPGEAAQEDADRADLSSLSAEAAPSYRDSPPPGSIVPNSQLPAPSSRAAPSSPSPLHPPQQFLTPQPVSRSSAEPRRGGRKSTGTVVRVARGSFGEILPALAAMRRGTSSSDLSAPPTSPADGDESVEQQAKETEGEQESEEQREAQSFALNELFLEGEAYGTDSEGEDEDLHDENVENRAPVLPTTLVDAPMNGTGDQSLAMPPPATPMRARGNRPRVCAAAADLQTPAMDMLRHMMSTKNAAVNTPDMRGVSDLFASPAPASPTTPMYGKLREMMATVPDSDVLLGRSPSAGSANVATLPATPAHTCTTTTPQTPDLAFLKHVFALPKEAVDAEPALHDLHRLFAEHEVSLSEPVDAETSCASEQFGESLRELMESPKGQKALVEAAVVAIGSPGAVAGTSASTTTTTTTPVQRRTPRKSLRESLARRLSRSVQIASPQAARVGSDEVDPGALLPADEPKNEEQATIADQARRTPRRSPSKAQATPAPRAEASTPGRATRSTRSRRAGTADGPEVSPSKEVRSGQVEPGVQVQSEEQTQLPPVVPSAPATAEEAKAPAKARSPNKARSRLPTATKGKAGSERVEGAVPEEARAPKRGGRTKRDAAGASSSSSSSPSKAQSSSPRAVGSDTSRGLAERQLNIQRADEEGKGGVEEGAAHKTAPPRSAPARAAPAQRKASALPLPVRATRSRAAAPKDADACTQSSPVRPRGDVPPSGTGAGAGKAAVAPPTRTRTRAAKEVRSEADELPVRRVTRSRAGRA